jgi:hypothetical protein
MEEFEKLVAESFQSDEIETPAATNRSSHACRTSAKNYRCCRNRIPPQSRRTDHRRPRAGQRPGRHATRQQSRSRTDHIRVDGKLLQGPERFTYVALNKPKGYVTTVSDEKKRPTVMDLVRR